MKRVDLRDLIIPTTINNRSCSERDDGSDFDTTDLIFLDSSEESFKSLSKSLFKSIERRVSPTDFAQMNNAIIYRECLNRLGRPTTWIWSRTPYSTFYNSIIGGDRNWRRNNAI